jgi:membrane protease YdiL (CAAX protease family)
MDGGHTMKRLAVQKAVTFLGLTLLFSLVFYRPIIRVGIAHSGFLVLGLMWCPGTAAIVTRLLYQRNLRGIGWGWGKTRYQLWSYAIPILYALAAYLVVWLGGFGRFPNPVFVHNLAEQFRLAKASPAVVIGVYVGVAGTLGMVWSSIFALGEEIGWRGLLVPELATVTSFTNTALVSGIIWAFWHFPLIFLGGYNGGTSRWYSALCFTPMVIGIATVFAWMRLKSGSVWTGMLLHASHNMFIQGIFDPLTQDTAVTKYVRGDFGVALAVVGLLVGYFFWRKRAQLV